MDRNKKIIDFFLFALKNSREKIKHNKSVGNNTIVGFELFFESKRNSRNEALFENDEFQTQKSVCSSNSPEFREKDDER